MPAAQAVSRHYRLVTVTDAELLARTRRASSRPGCTCQDAGCKRIHRLPPEWQTAELADRMVSAAQRQAYVRLRLSLMEKRREAAAARDVSLRRWDGGPADSLDLFTRVTRRLRSVARQRPLTVNPETVGRPVDMSCQCLSCEVFAGSRGAKYSRQMAEAAVRIEGARQRMAWAQEGLDRLATNASMS